MADLKTPSITPKNTPKKPNRRAKRQYPALEPQYNLKTRYDLIDYDYLHKLSASDKEWLNRFSEEFNNANFNHKGAVLHNTPALKKSCYDMNNARNRCILTRAKAAGRMLELKKGLKPIAGYAMQTCEDDLIYILDLDMSALRDSNAEKKI